ncbi:hypothetical protein [Priestia megaterium]|uniref:hypothetical protein n=1 Tax=Priestia megaterium TaxID=1404 RepID=UPI001D00AF13|nr:hypothetical protein [Priestia megaterium]
MTKNVIGTYDNEEAIVTAVQHLKIQGFKRRTSLWSPAKISIKKTIQKWKEKKELT